MNSRYRLAAPCLALISFLLIMAPAAAQASQSPDPALAKRLAGIEQKVSAIRQLPLKQPIQLEFMTRDQLQREVTGEIVQQYPKSAQERDERVLTAFGLIPAGTDLLKLQEAVQGEQIAGFYDPATHRMVVVRDAADPGSFSALDEIVFAHEVTHALQDQNLPLDQLTASEAKQFDDQNLATLALIEGDATSCQVDYLMANKRLIPAVVAQLNSPELSSDQLDKAPSYLRATLLFPYDQGLTFVNALKKSGGWAAVDKAYARPPVSTEQVLHPAKYLANEQPVPVTAPDVTAALGSGWSLVDTNDFGELGVRILLSGQPDSKGDANQAASGWGGDEYRVWAHGGQTAIVWQTAWDTKPDADQFAEALGTYEAQRWNAQVKSPVAGEQWFASAQAVTVIIEHGQTVTYMLAPDQATAERMVAAAGG